MPQHLHEISILMVPVLFVGMAGLLNFNGLCIEEILLLSLVKLLKCFDDSKTFFVGWVVVDSGSVFMLLILKEILYYCMVLVLAAFLFILLLQYDLQLIPSFLLEVLHN